MKSFPTEPAETVDAETAIGWLPSGTVCVRIGRLGGPMFGVTWSRTAVEDEIRRAKVVDISGPHARADGYGLAIRKDNGQTCLFFEAAVPESAVECKAPTGDQPR